MSNEEEKPEPLEVVFREWGNILRTSPIMREALAKVVNLESLLAVKSKQADAVARTNCDLLIKLGVAEDKVEELTRLKDYADACSAANMGRANEHKRSLDEYICSDESERERLEAKVKELEKIQIEVERRFDEALMCLEGSGAAVRKAVLIMREGES